MNALVPIDNGHEYRVSTDAAVEARFWSKVDKLGPDECWLWKGTILPAGYGRMKVARRQVLATHLALQFAGRPIEAGQHACHRCDNTSCVNPAHLFAGTRSDNMLDMYAKGRRSQRGEHNPNSTLTAEQVRAIRAHPGTQAEIAREFGIAAGTVSTILSRKKWSHIQ